MIEDQRNRCRLIPPFQRYYTTILNKIVLSKVRFGSEKRFKIQQGQISIATCGQ